MAKTKRLNKNLIGGLTFLAFVVITAAGVFMASELREVDPEQHAKKAASCAADEDYKTAARYYSRAFQVSEDPHYLVAAGEMKELDGEESQAVNYWIQAVTMDPALLEAQEKLLDYWMRGGGGALRIKETAEAILRIQEKSPKGLNALGRALLLLAGQPEGDREKGFENLHAAHEIAPEVYEYAEALILACWRDAQTLVQTDEEQARQRITEAFDLVKDLVAKNDKSGEDAANARVLYAGLLASSPKRDREVFLGQIHEHLGSKDRYAEAQRLHQEAVEMAGDDAEVKSTAISALANYWYEQSGAAEDPSKAEEHLEKSMDLARTAIEAWPTGFTSYKLLALAYARAGEHEKSAQTCEQRVDLPIERKGIEAGQQKRSRIELLLLAAGQYVVASSSRAGGEMGEEQLALLKKAEQLVEDARAEVLDPDRHGKSLHMLGKIKFVQGNELEALQYFEKADKADGAPGWQNKRWLGMLYYRQERVGAAREALLQAVRNPRADSQTWLTLAQVYLDYDEPESALVAADEALKRNPDLAAARRVKIAANQQLGREDLVARDLAQVDVGQASQSTFRARLLSSQGKDAEAFDMLKSVLAEDPTAYEALRLAGALARKLGKEREILGIVEKAIQADPGNFTLESLAIRLNSDLTEDQQKEKLLSLIQQEPDEYSRAYQLGEFYGASGQLEEALEQFDKAVQLLLSPQPTDAARRAGSKALLLILERQLLLSINQELWEKADTIVQVAVEQNVDGAHGMTFRGRVYMARKQYDAAIEALKLALTEQPSQSEAWGWLGECQYAMGRKTEAQASCERAAEINPESFRAQRRLAQFAKAAGKTDEFNKRLDKLVQLNPQDPWVAQQELLRQEERSPQEGIERREVLLEKNPDDLVNLVQLANLYRITGDTEKASQRYTTALKHPDSSLGVAWRAAGFFTDIGDADRAFQVLSDAREQAESNEDKAVVLLMTGTLYNRIGNLQMSGEQFRKAVDLDPSETTFISFGEHFKASHRYEEAIKWLEKGIEAADRADSPRAPRIRRARFDTLLQANRRDAAGDAVEEYRDLYPKDPAGHLMESELHTVLGQLDRAVTDLTQYLQVMPGDPKALYRRAQHYASRQKWQEVIEDLENLRALNPDALDYAPRILLSRAYDQMDRSDSALSELKALHGSHPAHRGISLQYLQYFMRHERYAEAESLATALANANPDEPGWFLYLGRVAEKQDDGAKALMSFSQAAEKSEYAWQYSAALLDSFKYFKNYGGGIRFFEETLPADKHQAPVTYRYAALLATKGRTAQAVRAYRQSLVEQNALRNGLFVSEVAGSAVEAFGATKAIELFREKPQDPGLAHPNDHILATLLGNLGHPAEAVAVLDALISTSTDVVERASLLGRKGMVAEADQDYSLAKQCYEDAVKANPGDYIVLNNLAYLLADKLGKPEEAVPYAEKAVQLNDQPAVVDTLAWTLVELGEYGRAIGLLSGILQRDFEFITGLAHLAEAYRRNGNFTDAMPLHKQALKLIDETGEDEHRTLVETGLQKALDKSTEP